jgi:hypothetical protein|nr:hypothetical protein [Kaiparowitsia implicata GSE-PSE-MK54-09C]
MTVGHLAMLMSFAVTAQRAFHHFVSSRGSSLLYQSHINLTHHQNPLICPAQCTQQIKGFGLVFERNMSSVAMSQLSSAGLQQRKTVLSATRAVRSYAFAELTLNLGLVKTEQTSAWHR